MEGNKVVYDIVMAIIELATNVWLTLISPVTVISLFKPSKCFENPASGSLCDCCRRHKKFFCYCIINNRLTQVSGENEREKERERVFVARYIIT